MTDYIAAKDGTVTRDPGHVEPDPARRPGQPGAQRQQVDDTPTSDKPARPGEVDDRGEPVDGARAAQVADEADPMEADLHEESPPLSDGSTRAGPI